MKKGCFITIEGVEGVGKSTNIAAIESLLRAEGIPFISTREPGGTPLSEKIRALLLDKNETAMHDKAELLLVFAARAQHVEALIKPALEKGQWVICDRFTDSSFAYQGFGRQSDISLIERVEKLALGDFVPDITFLLDLPVEIGLARASKRGELDRFESEDLEFFNRVRDGFLIRAKADRTIIIDAGGSLAEIEKQIAIHIQARIKSWR
ncbi:MAG: dTMP kinase [Pseudomonadales bacterium]|nr:dTMP kinase [Pseudomonadales bacterium]